MNILKGDLGRMFGFICTSDTWFLLYYFINEIMFRALHNVCPSLPCRPVDENGEESDEPPKVEVQEIKETDAFYSKK